MTIRKLQTIAALISFTQGMKDKAMQVTGATTVHGYSEPDPTTSDFGHTNRFDAEGRNLYRIVEDEFVRTLEFRD